MTIHNITHNPQYHIKKATITLSYEEIRDIANLLYEASKDENTHSEQHILNRDFFLLFELVKNGCIDSFTIEHLNEIQTQSEKVLAERNKNK